MFLSIAIPSNNKKKYLFEAIKSILNDNYKNNNFEICISDNSKDNKSDEINSFFKNNKIKYHLSDCFKMDENINNVVNLSVGEYVWLFGDDDLLIDGALDAINIYLKKNKPDVLILNSSSFIENKIIEDFRFKKKTNYVYDYDQDDLFLKEMGNYITYIGSIVIKKNIWQKYFNQNSIGSYFSHLKVICEYKINNKIHYLSFPCIKMRVKSQTWTSEYFKIWNFNFSNIIWSLNKYSENSKSSVIIKQPYKSIFRLLSSRAYGHFNYKIFKDLYFKANDINYLKKILIFIISIFNIKLLKTIYTIYIKLFRNKIEYSFSPKLALELLNDKNKK